MNEILYDLIWETHFNGFPMLSKKLQHISIVATFNFPS